MHAHALQEQLVALEAANMAAFERNGESFAAYFTRWDLMIHTAKAADGTLMGFAISGAEGRGKLFLYELHVATTSPRRSVVVVWRQRCSSSSSGRADRAARHRRWSSTSTGQTRARRASMSMWASRALVS